MIPVIALMIALYIITKMVHLLIDKRKEIHIVTATLSIVTILASVYAIYYCLSKGAELASLLK